MGEVNQSWTYRRCQFCGKGCEPNITSCDYDAPMNERRQRRQWSPRVGRLSTGDRTGGSKFGDAGICVLPFPQEPLRFLPCFGNFPIVLQ